MAKRSRRRRLRGVEPWFWELVEAGDTRAMVCVGDDAYRDRQYAQAARWYQPAADAGDGTAMLRLGNMAEDGIAHEGTYRLIEGGRAARARAEPWYRAAVEAGNIDAISSLAYTTTDAAEADRLHRRAREAGIVPPHGDNFDVLLGRYAESVRWYVADAQQPNNDSHVPAALWLLRELDKLTSVHDRVRRDVRWRYLLVYPRLRYRLPVVATAMHTTALQPFVQTLLSGAAHDRLRRLYRECAGEPRERFGGELLVVQDPELDVGLHLWTDTPQEAIHALSNLDLSTGGAGSSRVIWNQATRTWQWLSDLRRAGPAR